MFIRYDAESHAPKNCGITHFRLEAVYDQWPEELDVSKHG